MVATLTDQNFTNNFWKGSPKKPSYEIISKSDKRFQRRRILKNFSEIHTVQKGPHPHRAIFFDRSKFGEKLLERVTQGTILWNYSKFWPAVSKEEIFKEFLQVHTVQKASTRPPPPPPPPHGCHVFFLQIRIREQYLKRVTQATILLNYYKIGLAISEEKIFKEFLKKFNLVAMATRVFYGIKLCEQFSKRTNQGTFLSSLVQIGPVACEEMMFKEILNDALINPFPNNKHLNQLIFKLSADDKLNEIKDDKVKNIVGKGENAGYQHFLLFL